LQSRYRLRINPAFHFLTSPLHADKTRLTELFYVMRGVLLMSVTTFGLQQDIKRKKIFSRFGLERALNISANCLIFLSR
jgi:hypothetical protein